MWRPVGNCPVCPPPLSAALVLIVVRWHRVNGMRTLATDENGVSPSGGFAV